jgi:hypothetical protein
MYLSRLVYISREAAINLLQLPILFRKHLGLLPAPGLSRQLVIIRGVDQADRDQSTQRKVQLITPESHAVSAAVLQVPNSTGAFPTRDREEACGDRNSQTGWDSPVLDSPPNPVLQNIDPENRTIKPEQAAR